MLIRTEGGTQGLMTGRVGVRLGKEPALGQNTLSPRSNACTIVYVSTRGSTAGTPPTTGDPSRPTLLVA